VLETLGVPVAGYRTNKFPAFYAEDSGLPLQSRVDTPAEAALWMQLHWQLGLMSGIVFCNPPPSASALGKQEVDGWIAQALQSAAAVSAGLFGESEWGQDSANEYCIARTQCARGGANCEGLQFARFCVRLLRSY
jgi:pseudouridine-5'-phosphate glycosidase